MEKRLKIAVIQPALGRIGGHLQTVMAFADTFKSIGHDVRVFSTLSDPSILGGATIIRDTWEIPEYYNLSNIVAGDIVWEINDGLIQAYSPDVIFCAGRYRSYTKNIAAIKIGWMVGACDEGGLEQLDAYWTNSPVTRKKLKCNAEVVVAPHDYRIFRENKSNKKMYDVIGVMRSDFTPTGKGLELYASVVKSLGLRSILITTIENEKKQTLIRSLGVDYIANVSRRVVAELMGKSKTLLLTSYQESCPLVIYEALNSGLMVVARDVGAISWQLSGHGLLFSNDDEALPLIREAVDTEVDEETVVNLGRGYDRETITRQIDQLLGNMLRSV